MTTATHPIAAGRDHCGGPGICPTCSSIYAQQNPTVSPAQPKTTSTEPPPTAATPGPHTTAGQGHLTINVIGTPAPQGSKRAFVVNGRAVMTESSKKVKPWRQDVVAAIEDRLDAIVWQVPEAAVEVAIVFYLPRPRYHYGTGRNASVLKPTAPAYVDKKPDSDKLARSTLDALTTSRVIRDDAQVARLIVEKRYADAKTGARITITPLTVPAPALNPETGAGAAQPEGALF